MIEAHLLSESNGSAEDYDTVVGNQRRKLSGKEKQRISIARVAY